MAQCSGIIFQMQNYNLKIGTLIITYIFHVTLSYNFPVLSELVGEDPIRKR